MDISALHNFAETLKAKFSLPGAASPEDQLKPGVAQLMKDAGTAFKLAIDSRTETHLSAHQVRPDMAIYVGGLICGYVELKAPGLGADAPKLKGEHNKTQWEKLKVLPNLIYTDGREWALYRNGARQGDIVRLDNDPTEKGKKAVTPANRDEMSKLLRSFLFWMPSVPHKPTELAKYLAPLTRFLRSEVEAALGTSGSDIEALATEWRSFFFPTADDAQFADAYAQTVTYAMLLARLSGATKLNPEDAAKKLDAGNRLLARTLALLGQPAAREELRVGFELLKRSLEALDPADFLKSKPDLWLYFYEDFLAAYDPKLRRDYGVYYTPREVVELQVRLASELLEKRFGKKLGFADDGVVFLDPAVGTGTYPVAAVKHALEKVRDRSGAGAVAGRAAQMAQNLYGFEILVGPYAVAHLRLTQALEGSGAKIPDRLKIYLADTLESPNATPPGGLSLTYKALTQEHEAARKIKNEGEILVCLGNPPYDRQNIEEGDTATQRKGGWVRFGDQVKGGAKSEKQNERPIFADFTEPAAKSGRSIHLKNLYNDYVYFWRWALWRLFEQQKCGGIITFITASSYLAGPGFVGMRELMRRTFDELWILDLGGDNLGTRQSPNVFNIQTPVAIAIGVRGKNAVPSKPARIHYAKVVGDTRESKLSQIDSYADSTAIKWQRCPGEWHAPFLPVGKGDYFDWPEIVELFPWCHSGTQFKRSWPIGETEAVLEKRFRKLTLSSSADRGNLFRETGDRRVTWEPQGGGSASISKLNAKSIVPSPSRYSFRSLDRHFALMDERLGDRLRPELRAVISDKQLYLTTLLSFPLGLGPAMIAAAHLPDLHHFCGRGGKDVIPLYRDAAATVPNVTSGLLDVLETEHGNRPSAEDLAGYVYALLAGQSYTNRFWNELETPSPRVPLTKNGATFQEVAALGCRLIWLHTYAERFRGPGCGKEVPIGKAKNIKAVSSDPAQYPEDYAYDAKTREIRIGTGLFGPVSLDVWEFQVSGLKVVQSWLGYRMKKRAGKRSSSLDDIRPESWTPRLTDEFLELLWVLEASLAMEPVLSASLDKVVAGPCFKSDELPKPTADERKPPRGTAGHSKQLSIFDDGMDETGDE